MKIIGREKEINVLQSLLEQQEAHFVAVYGRRRVGKTYGSLTNFVEIRNF